MFCARHLLAGISLLIGFISYSQAENLTLNGAARYQELGQEKFIASLHLETPSSNPATIYNAESTKQMQIQLTSNYSKRRWVNLWMQSMAINNSSDKFNETADELVALFEKQQGSLRANDIVKIEYNPSNKTSYSLNGVTLASEQPAELFNLFLSAWIGRVPPSSGFRDAILGSADSSDLAGPLATIKPSATRTADIEAWLQPEEPVIAEQTEPELSNESVQSTIAELADPVSDSPDNATDLVAAAETIPETQPASAEGDNSTTKITQAVELAADNTTAPSSQESLPQHQIEPTADQVDFDTEEELVAAVSVEMIMAIKEYTRSALQQVYKSIRYPKVAARRGLEGQVRVMVKVDRDGNLVEATATEESEHSSLNKAALKAVSKAAPFASVPEAILDDPLEVTIPISFRMQ